jgi:hypothetical protein
MTKHTQLKKVLGLTLSLALFATLSIGSVTANAGGGDPISNWTAKSACLDKKFILAPSTVSYGNRHNMYSVTKDSAGSPIGICKLANNKGEVVNKVIIDKKQKHSHR